MKNIVFKFLPLVAAVLFATSCSKDDGNDNSVVTDINTTNEPTTAPSTATSETTNGVQVEVDENGVPYIPFSITVGQDSESLSKVSMQTDPDASNYCQQWFTEYDKIKITGRIKRLNSRISTKSFGRNIHSNVIELIVCTNKWSCCLSSKINYNFCNMTNFPKVHIKINNGRFINQILIACDISCLGRENRTGSRKFFNPDSWRFILMINYIDYHIML